MSSGILNSWFKIDSDVSDVAEFSRNMYPRAVLYEDDDRSAAGVRFGLLARSGSYL
jgi:hypothetical protein